MFFVVLANTVLALTAEVITPTELNAQLAQPAVASYRQAISDLPQHPDNLKLLNRLPQDPVVPNGAREWLLVQAAETLRTQPRTAAAEQWLQALQQYPAQTQLANDFEGRIRPVPLAPVAQAARATLGWWQRQELAAQIRTNLSADTISAAARHWTGMAEPERAGWLLAVTAPAPDWSARLAGLPRTELAKQAPALAARLAVASNDAELAAQVLSHDRSDSATQLLSQVPEHFPADEIRLYEAALGNSGLRSQSWLQLAKSTSPRAQTLLRQSALAGDRSAIAGWLQQQGDAALPELQRWLQSKVEKQQLSAVFALKILATPGAQTLLIKARQFPALSARARQELQP